MADIGNCPEIVRTRFLGLSVIDFSCSAGWNEQPSEITINLVQDCATDEFGNVHEERFGVLQGGTYPDPLNPFDRAQNVVQPSMGSLHTFVLYQPEMITIHKGPPFKFIGCLQSINKSIGADGNPVCSVKLVSPHFLLENAQVILDHYQEPLPIDERLEAPAASRLNNIINVYGYLEQQLGDFCPFKLINNTYFGAPSTGFSGIKTDRGIPWYFIKMALMALLGGGRFDEWCYQGQLVWGEEQGANPHIGFPKGLDNPTSDYYYVDFSSLPVPSEAGNNWHYRFAGPVVSLKDLITQVCEDAGCDWFLTTIQGDINLLKIIVIPRIEQPTINSSYISDSLLAMAEGAAWSVVPQGGGEPLLLSESLGREFRSEVNTFMLVGGKIKNYYQCTQKYHITPFWGWNSEGSALLRSQHNGEILGWQVQLDFRKVNQGLSVPMTSSGGFSYAWVGENELRAALGDYESFLKNITMPSNDSSLATYYRANIKIKPADVENHDNSDELASINFREGSEGNLPQSYEDGGAMFPDGGGGNARPTDDKSGRSREAVLKDGKTLHSWLQAYASEYYGKQFLALFTLDNVICRSVNTENNTTIYTDEPSPDGGWPTHVAPVGGDNIAAAAAGMQKYDVTDATHILGLPNNDLPTDFFKDDTGKVQPMVVFYTEVEDGEGQINTEALDINEYVIMTADSSLEDPTEDIDDPSEDAAEGDKVPDPNKGPGIKSGKQYLWVKATVEQEWIPGSPFQGHDGIDMVGALLKINDPVGVVGPSIDTNSPIDSFSLNGDLTYNPVVMGTETEIIPMAEVNLGGQTEAVRSLGPAAMTFPIGAGVPIQSNTQSYGPWTNVGLNPGSMQVEIDDGLVPWEYGSTPFLLEAGWQKIAEAITKQTTADRGQITVPGLPDLHIGMNIDGSFAELKEDTIVKDIGDGDGKTIDQYKSLASRTAGAVVSNINCSFGAGGVTTTYELSTYTPVFGRFSKGNAERLKQMGVNKAAGERRVRASTALNNVLRASAVRSGKRARMVSTDMGKGSVSPQSPTVYFAGKLGGRAINTEKKRQYDSRRKVVLAGTKHDLAHYKDTQHTAAISMDGFFRPYVTQEACPECHKDENAPNLPKMVSDPGPAPQQMGDCGSDILYQTMPPPPPTPSMTAKPEIRTKYLDFLGDSTQHGNPGLFSAQGDGTTGVQLGPDGEGGDPTISGGVGSGSRVGVGHDIEAVARGVNIETPTCAESWRYWGGEQPGKARIHALSEGTSGTDIKDFAALYKPLALRGPLVIHGWGYDVHGYPVPNTADEPNKFVTDYTKCGSTFATNWMEDATTWPVAPVDLRFDRQRGVWTIPPAYRLYQVKTPEVAPAEISWADGESTVSPTTVVVTIEQCKSDIPDYTIEAKNYTPQGFQEGDRGYVYYDAAVSEYWLFGGTGGEGGGGGCPDVDDTFSVLTDICCSGATFGLICTTLRFVDGCFAGREAGICGDGTNPCEEFGQ